MSRVRAIALYLPQFHPVPANDAFWGKGFTEWTNVTKARPLFPHHRQPRLPADLGFYDLRVPETRSQQAELAASAGIEAFCYWHYWFGGGVRVLERVFQEVVDTGQPDFPFCLAWANQSWTGRWHGLDSSVIFHQTYPGQTDFEQHFYALLDAFHDQRYLRFDGRLVFMVYEPQSLPRSFLSSWNSLAMKEGLPGFYFVGFGISQSEAQRSGYHGFIAAQGVNTDIYRARKDRRLPVRAFDYALKQTRIRRCTTVNYSDYVRSAQARPLAQNEIPVVVPNWDNTPRRGGPRNGLDR